MLAEWKREGRVWKTERVWKNKARNAWAHASEGGGVIHFPQWVSPSLTYPRKPQANRLFTARPAARSYCCLNTGLNARLGFVLGQSNCLFVEFLSVVCALRQDWSNAWEWRGSS
jgi:hypothetical protein